MLVTREPSDPILARSSRAIVGDRPEKVAIVLSEYDPAWPRRFEVEKQSLETALGRLGAQAWLTGTDAELFDGLRGAAQFFAVADASLAPA